MYKVPKMSVEMVTVKVEPMDLSMVQYDEENSESPHSDDVQEAPIPPVLPALETKERDLMPQNTEDRKNSDVSNVSPSHDCDMDDMAPQDLSQTSHEPEFISIKLEIKDECDSYQFCPSSPEQNNPEYPEPSSHSVDYSNEGQNSLDTGNGESQSYMISVDPSYLINNDNDSSCESSDSDFDTTKYIRNKDVRTIMSKVKDNFECVVCKMNLSTKSNLQRHLMRHIKHKIVCKECKRQFLCKEMLKRHIKYTHEEKIFNCDVCPLSFKFSAELLKHKRTHVIYTCAHCDKQYTDCRLYETHVARKRCKKNLHLPCGECGKVFKREYLYQSHMRAHTKERPYQCDECKMKFKDKSTLTRHLQLHEDNKPYACKICGKRFAVAGLIKPHMRTHTGDRPFVCTICDKAFSHKHNMQRHFESHEKKKNKQLVCEICLKVFPRESRLMYHMRIHTENKRPFKCDVCPKKFSCRQNIVRHYKRKHPDATYNSIDTDASVARELWQRILERKMSEAEELIVPDDEGEAREVVEGPPSPECKPKLKDEDWILRIKT